MWPYNSRSRWSPGVSREGLLGWWPLNEGGGNTALDFSGNNQHFSLVASPAYKERGLEFDGTTQYATAVCTLPATISVAFWVFPISSVHRRVPLAIDSDAYSSGPCVFFASNAVTWNTGDDDSNKFSGSVYPPLKAWTHWVFENDAKNNLCRLFTNSSSVFSAGYRNALTTRRSLVLGRFHAGSYYFPGRLSDLRIFSRILSPSEIIDLFKFPAT